MLKCQLRYPTHRVYIQYIEQSVHCFKYTENHCTYELFSPGELDSLSDYIMEPLPKMVYAVDFPDSDQN